jgi:hypothetical protein
VVMHGVPCVREHVPGTHGKRPPGTRCISYSTKSRANRAVIRNTSAAKSLFFAIHQRQKNDQHSQSPIRVLHGDAKRSPVPTLTWQLLLICRTRCLLNCGVLRRNLHIASSNRSLLQTKNAPRPAFVAATQASTGTGNPPRARAANDLHALRCISTRWSPPPCRLASQTQLAVCESARDQQAHTSWIIFVRPPCCSIVSRISRADDGREKQ